MTDATPTRTETPQAGASRRKGPPAWGVVAFLLLLVGVVVINQLARTGGSEIKWIENDLDGALARLTDPRERVFVYLYEPNDPIHQRNEREVFTQRWARKPLEDVVCCRVALRKSDPHSVRLMSEFAYQDTPEFLLLNRSRVPVSRLDGAATETEFFTRIGLLAERAGQVSRELPAATSSQPGSSG